MKLLRKKPLVIKQEPPKERKTHKNTLPPDTYQDEIEPKRLKIDDNTELVFSVKRGGELGLPRVDIRQYVKTENYEGFTKKGINFALEYLYDFIDICSDVSEECDKANIE